MDNSLKNIIIDKLNDILNINNDYWNNLDKNFKLKYIHRFCNYLEKNKNIENIENIENIKNIENINQIDYSKVSRIVDLIVPSQSAKLSPPVGPILGQVKIKVKDFCVSFNEKTTIYKFKNPRVRETVKRFRQFANFSRDTGGSCSPGGVFEQTNSCITKSTEWIIS